MLAENVLLSVAMPVSYRDVTGSICEFKDERFKSILQNLLQYTSPGANLEGTPEYRVFKGVVGGWEMGIRCGKGAGYIPTENSFETPFLNYTKEAITYCDRNILVKGKSVSYLDKINGLIAYHVDKHEPIICLEVSVNNYFQRHFVTAQADGYTYHTELPIPDGLSTIEKCAYADLGARHFKGLDASKDKVSSRLNQYLVEEACLKSLPSLSQFVITVRSNSAQLDGVQFFMYRPKILNHTDHKITLDINGFIVVNGFRIDEYVPQTENLVAYHLKGQPEKIYFEHQNKNLSPFCIEECVNGESKIWKLSD